MHLKSTVPAPEIVPSGPSQRSPAPRWQPGLDRPGPGRSIALPLAVLVALPVLVMAAGAWHAWRETWRGAAAEIGQTADAAAEFGQRTLSAFASAAGRVDAVLRGLSDAEIRAREAALHEELKDLVAEVPQAEASFVIDRDGRALLSANVFPVPRGERPPIAADREFFLALRGEDPPTIHVSRVYTGRLDGSLFFAISRRRTRTGNADLPPGAFDGLVNLSVYPNRLAEGLGRLAAREGDVVGLVRNDGEILARSIGQAGPLRVPPGSRFPEFARAGAARALYEGVSTTDGRPQLVALRRIEGWPVYAAAARQRSAILADWRRAVAGQLALGLPATLALFGLALFVWRRLSSERAALEARVATRTTELAESEARFLRALHTGRIFAFEWDAATDAVLRSPSAAAILGLPVEGRAVRDTGRAFLGGVHPEDRPRVEAAIARATPAHPDYEVRFRWRRPDGGIVWLHDQGMVRFGADGRMAGVTSLARDTTAEAGAEAALRAGEERLRLATEAARLGTWEIDLAGGTATRSARTLDIFGFGPDSRAGSFPSWRDRVHPEDREGLEAAVAAVREGREERYRAVYRFQRPDGAWRWVESHGQGIDRDPATGRPARLVGTTQDVTERRVAEERMVLLAREVDHRAKNALAVVQAAIRLAPRHDADAFARAVEGRVAALARAQVLLAEGGWQGAELRALAEGALSAFLPRPEEAGPRVLLAGPPVRLAASATQPLALALHELATNATKHGAFSAPTGVVSLDWSVDEGAGLLRLRWAESGGPGIAAPPARRGFGSRVLEGTVRGQLGGEVSLSWRAEGLVCEIAVPVARSLAPGEDDRVPAAE